MDEDTGVKELLFQLTASDSSKEARHNGLLLCTCTPPELCFILTNMSVNHIKTNIHVQNMSQTMSEFPYMADCLSMFSACQSGTGSPGNFGWRWQQLLSFNQNEELMGLLCAWWPFYSHRNIRIYCWIILWWATLCLIGSFSDLIRQIPCEIIPDLLLTDALRLYQVITLCDKQLHFINWFFSALHFFDNNFYPIKRGIVCFSNHSC